MTRIDTNDTGDTDTGDTSDTDTNDTGDTDMALCHPQLHITQCIGHQCQQPDSGEWGSSSEILGWEVLACDVNKDGYDDVCRFCTVLKCLVG